MYTRFFENIEYHGVIVILMRVTGEYDNGLMHIERRKIALVIIKQIIALLGFN